VRAVVRTERCDDAGTPRRVFVRIGDTLSAASRLIVSVPVAYSV